LLLFSVYQAFILLEFIINLFIFVFIYILQFVQARACTIRYKQACLVCSTSNTRCLSVFLCSFEHQQHVITCLLCLLTMCVYQVSSHTSFYRFFLSAAQSSIPSSTHRFHLFICSSISLLSSTLYLLASVYFVGQCAAVHLRVYVDAVHSKSWYNKQSVWVDRAWFVSSIPSTLPTLLTLSTLSIRCIASTFKSIRYIDLIEWIESIELFE